MNSSEPSWNKDETFKPEFQSSQIESSIVATISNDPLDINESLTDLPRISMDKASRNDGNPNLFKKLDQTLQENSQASWSKGNLFKSGFQPVSLMTKKNHSDIVENPQVNMKRMNILETSSACHPNISSEADEFFQGKKKQVLITSFSEDLDESDIQLVI